MHISYLGKRYSLDGSLLAPEAPEAKGSVIVLDVDCPEKETSNKEFYHLPQLFTKGKERPAAAKLYLIKLEDQTVAMYLEGKLYLASSFSPDGHGQSGLTLDDLPALYGDPVYIDGDHLAKLASSTAKKAAAAGRKSQKAGQKLSADLAKLQRFSAMLFFCAVLIFACGKGGEVYQQSRLLNAKQESEAFTKRTETLIAGKAGAVVRSLNNINVQEKLQTTMAAAPFLDISEYLLAEKVLTVKFKNPERGALEIHELERLGAVSKDGQSITVTFNK